MSHRIATLFIGGLLLAGLVGVGLMPGGAAIAQPPASQPSTATTRKMVYVCAAHMGIRSEYPGRCHRCGAALIPTPE